MNIRIAGAIPALLHQNERYEIEVINGDEKC